MAISKQQQNAEAIAQQSERMTHVENILADLMDSVSAVGQAVNRLAHPVILDPVQAPPAVAPPAPVVPPVHVPAAGLPPLPPALARLQSKTTPTPANVGRSSANKAREGKAKPSPEAKPKRIVHQITSTGALRLDMQTKIDGAWVAQGRSKILAAQKAKIGALYDFLQEGGMEILRAYVEGRIDSRGTVFTD